ncbi:MAG: N-acetyl-alpha-D-glucosaminyl L-malate synthase BshA [Planctomycetota bacterium JB042]
MNDRSLRIGIACYPTYGGSGIVATELGIGLAEHGHDVHFLAYADLPRVQGASRVQQHIVEVSAYPLFKFPPYDLALASKMRELLEGEGLDILHVHYAIPHSISAYLARQMSPHSRAKVVTTLHGTDITVVGADPAYREVTRFGLLHSDRILAVSEFLVRETRETFGIDREIVVAPNFVDTDRFRPGARPSGRPPVLVHVSNFRAVKRPLDVVQAFAMACRDDDARLRLAGDGPELAPCLELAEKLKVRDRIDALGEVQKVEEVLADADILLQPSGTEAFGLAALEAAACGVPTIGYVIGGLPEVVVDGETGFLVPFKDVKARARRTRERLDDPARLAAFRIAARERAVERFCRRHSLEQHERIYFEVLADGAGS